MEKNSYSAVGRLHFKIYMLNKSDKPSAEIEAIYIYSGNGWRLYQDDRECPSTDSDVANFTQRHFLTAPLRRLQKGAWAQLKFSGRKTLAWATKGEKMKDSYRVNGKALLKLVTEDGDFDYELIIDTTADDIPF